MKAVLDASTIEIVCEQLVDGFDGFSKEDGARADSVAALVNEFAENTASVQYTVIYAMSSVAKSKLGGPQNHRLSAAIGRYVAKMLNFDLALEAEDPLFRDLYLEFIDVGERYPDWLAGRLVPSPSEASTEARQLPLPGINYRMPESVNFNPMVSKPGVYVASAITLLTPPQLEEIREQSRIASAAYSRFGYGIHQPIIHTHPDLTQEMSHAEVHSIDYGHVANSDVLVLLGEHPSFGAGKELAWADTYQLTVVIVAPPEIRISRLLTGSPGHVLEPIRFDGHEQLAALLDQVARQGLARAKTHMENRFDREKRFLKVWLDLRRRVLSTDPAFFNSFRELISPERIKEIITSPTHFVGATVDELSAIKRCLGRVPSQDAPNDESVRDTHLTAASVQSLLDAQAAYQWSLEDCYALVRLAEEQFLLQGVRRLTLNSIADWAAFKRDSGV